MGNTNQRIRDILGARKPNGGPLNGQDAAIANIVKKILRKGNAQTPVNIQPSTSITGEVVEKDQAQAIKPAPSSGLGR